jgi:membrane-associated phospholipid phosphatase
VDLPFVEEVDATSAIKLLRLDLPVGGYADRHWAARWKAWVLLEEFLGTAWEAPALAAVDVVWNTPITVATTNAEIDELVVAARDERPEALGEILSQDVEFITDFMGLLAITPGSHPHTYRLLHLANLIATYAAMHFKGKKSRPRPSHNCPALRPPIPVPGHASFPSGHATQAYLMALFIERALASKGYAVAVARQVKVLAVRIARNREIAGLHYPTDSVAGRRLAVSLRDTLIAAAPAGILAAINAAGAEWP